MGVLSYGDHECNFPNADLGNNAIYECNFCDALHRLEKRANGDFWVKLTPRQAKKWRKNNPQEEN